MNSFMNALGWLIAHHGHEVLAAVLVLAFFISWIAERFEAPESPPLPAEPSHQ